MTTTKLNEIYNIYYMKAVFAACQSVLSTFHDLQSPSNEDADVKPAQRFILTTPITCNDWEVAREDGTGCVDPRGWIRWVSLMRTHPLEVDE